MRDEIGLQTRGGKEGLKPRKSNLPRFSKTRDESFSQKTEMDSLAQSRRARRESEWTMDLVEILLSPSK